MLLALWSGLQVGFFVALPVGPVAIMLTEMTLRLKGWRVWPLAAFLAGWVLVVHTFLAMTCANIIVEIVDSYPVPLYMGVSIILFYIAWKAHKSAQNNHAVERAHSVYTPCIVSLVCPFETVLVLHAMTHQPYLLDHVLGWSEKIIVACAAGVGGGLTYMGMMTFLRVSTLKAPLKFIKACVRFAPLTIVAYGVQNAWKACQFLCGV